MQAAMVIDQMNPVLYKAVVKGNLEDYHEALRQMPEEEARRRQVTPKGNTVLHVAAIHGHRDLVERILEEVHDVDAAMSLLFAKNKRNESVLHCAAEKGYDGVVSVIFSAVKKHEDVESAAGGRVRKMIEMRDDAKDTALHKAVRMGHLEVVKLLIQEDPEFEYLVNYAEETPIYIAAELQYHGCLKEMLNKCRNPTYGGPLGRNALHAAILSGLDNILIKVKSTQEFISLEGTQSLLEKNIRLCEEPDKSGWTPLHYAVKIDNDKAARMILERKISAAYICAGNSDEWTTTFHIAATHGKVEMIKEISNKCPDCWEMVNSKGQNVLHEAILSKKVNVIRHIEESSDQFENLVTQKDEDGNTPLHLLAVTDRSIILRRFDMAFLERNKLNFGDKWLMELASCSAMAIDGMMPETLYIAAVEGNEDYFEALEEAAYNGVTTAYGGNTVLHVAALHGHKQFVEKILLAETQEDHRTASLSSMLLARNNNGETVLHCAAEKGYADIVSLAISATRKYKDLELGVGVREMIGMMDNAKDTALHKAVRMGHLEVVKLLVKEDPEFEYFANDAGETPIYIAAELQFDECLVEMLNTCKKPSYDGPLGRNALHAAVLSGFGHTQNPFRPTIRTVIEFMSFYSYAFRHLWDIKVHTTKCTTPLLERELSLCEKIDDFGWTPLHYAVRVSNDKAAAMILERKRCAAYIHAGNNKEWTTIFHIATWHGDIEMMKMIIKSCPDCWEMKNSKGQNVLHEAVLVDKFARTRVIRHIESSNQFDNLVLQKDQDGNIPLHLLDLSYCYTLRRILSQRPKQNYMVFNKKHQTLLDLVLRPASPYAFSMILTRFWSRRKVARRVGLTANPNQTYKEEKKIQIFVETSKTIIVVATLILTMTLAAGFTVPGGYDSNPGKTQGMPILLLRNKAFLAFIIPDIYAFMCSICAIIIHSVMVEEVSSSKRYTTILWLYRIQRGFLIHACLGAVIAFLCGIYVTLTPLRPLAIVVLVLGFAIFLPIIKTVSHFKGETGLLG